MTLEEFAGNVENRRPKSKKGGPAIEGRCPVCAGIDNGDKDGTHLLILQGDDGYFHVRCVARRCSEDGILAGIGRTQEQRRWRDPVGQANAPARRTKPPKPADVVYRYTDALQDVETREWTPGPLLFTKKRYTVWQESRWRWKKLFSQNGAGGEPDLKHLDEIQAKVLYALPRVREAVRTGQRVFLVEGEKEADLLRVRGEVGTCQPEGAGNGKFLPFHVEEFRGATVVIVAHRDAPGEAYARQVYRALRPVAESVRVVRSKTRGEAHDLADHLGADYGLDELEHAADLEGDLDVADPPEELFEEAEPPSEEVSASVQFWLRNMMTVDQVMEQPDKDMLVKDLIGRQDRWIWAGAPGCGKTFGALNLLVACAIGGEFAGFDVPRPLHVVYCSSEGKFKMKNRLRAVLDQFGVTLDDVRPYMRFFPEVPQYHEIDGEQSIWGLAEVLKSQAFLPDILTIDTLSTATLGSKEQDNSEAARVCETANQVGKFLNCSTGFLHHTGWEGGRPRGASAFFGAMDVVLLQERIGETKSGTIKCSKGKDIDSFRPLSYRLVGVPEHDSAIMEFGESDEVEAELTALQQILVVMSKRPDREWWTVADLLDAIGGKVKRAAIQNTLRRQSDTRSGNVPVFDWDGKAKPYAYRRRLF